MSIIVSSCNEIHDSQLNNSSAKPLWSFSKAQRFQSHSKSINCAKAFYDLPSTQDQRKAGIGRGTKYDFTKFLAKTPGPDRYLIQGEIEQNKKKHKGYLFGVSRDKMAQSGILSNLNVTNPGPGKYPVKTTLSDIKFTMRPRYRNDSLMNTSTVPGPGSYPILPGITQDGKYILSHFKGSCATTFNPPHSKRFNDSTKSMKDPGPGSYALDKTYIQKDGKYFISKMQSSKCRSFTHEYRRTGSMGHYEKTPGPGAYRLPSDFGYYQSKNSIQ